MTDSGNTVTLQQDGTSSNNGHPQTINSTLRICLNFKMMCEFALKSINFNQCRLMVKVHYYAL